ncbi:hypothetical protein AKJ16_DCAP13330 [Drosera capensis]
MAVLVRVVAAVRSGPDLKKEIEPLSPPGSAAAAAPATTTSQLSLPLPATKSLPPRKSEELDDHDQPRSRLDSRPRRGLQNLSPEEIAFVVQKAFLSRRAGKEAAATTS